MKRTILVLTIAVLLSSEAAIAQSGNGHSGGNGRSEIKESRRERFDRGLAFDTRTPSMPKGMWVAGLSASFRDSRNDNFDAFIISDLNGRGSHFNISPMIHYVFANNQSIGVRFSYGHRLVDMSDVDFHLTDELFSMLFGDGGLKYQYQSNSYMGYVSYRYYLGIGSSKRFLLFNEVQAGFGGGTQREDSGVTDAGTFRRTTHQTSRNFRIGFAPGATMFLTNSLATELQIGLLGYEYRKLTQESTEASTTDAPSIPQKGSRTTHNASAKFDFFSINFGLTLYL